MSKGHLHEGNQVASGAESEGHPAAFQSRHELELAQPPAAPWLVCALDGLPARNACSKTEVNRLGQDSGLVGQGAGTWTEDFEIPSWCSFWDFRTTGGVSFPSNFFLSEEP